MTYIQRPRVTLIPRPRKLTAREGSFTIDARTTISAPGEAGSVAEVFREQLCPALGFPLPDAFPGKLAAEGSVSGME